jgi:hypothetical protein
MSDRRQKPLSTMTHTRIFIGVLSVVYGIAGYIFSYKSGISGVVQFDNHGWLWAFLLITFGGIMMLSAIAEIRGCTGRWSREVAASLLAITWLGIFARTFEGGADTISLIAPVMIGGILWSWFAEAKVARVVAKREAK